MIRKLRKCKVYSCFKDDIWFDYVEDLQLIKKIDKGIRFWLCVFDILSKHAWIFLMRDKKGIIITNDFQTISDMSNRKPNKVWVDKGSKFYSRLIKSWFTT